jgi:small-conductance mechanosensitive channel
VHITNADQLWPLVWVVGGFAVGLIVYALLLRPLRRMTLRRGWSSLSSVTRIIGGLIILWGGLAGAYLSLDHFTLSQRSQTFIERSLSALFVLSLAWLAARLSAVWVSSLGRRSDHRLFSVSLYATIVQAVVLIIGLITVLSSLGIAITPILTTLGLGGLAIALALNDTLSNLFSGVQIVAARQIRLGDYVKFDFAEGTVTDIQWHNTTIRDLQNNLVVIPNAKVNTAPFTNFSLGVSDLIVPVNALVPWKGSAELLEGIARQAASEAVADASGKPQSEQCTAAISAINETNVQITANLYVGHVDNRSRCITGYLSRLHDATTRENMGATDSAREEAHPAQATARAAVQRRSGSP